MLPTALKRAFTGVPVIACAVCAGDAPLSSGERNARSTANTMPGPAVVPTA